MRKLTFAEYQAEPGVNFSTLKHFDRSPAHAREYMLHPPAPSAAQELGQAVHCAILEPERYRVEYAISPGGDRRTREGKIAWAAFEAEHPGATVLTADDGRTIEAIRASIMDHPFATQLVAQARLTEVSVVWDVETTAGHVRCKSRLDGVSNVVGWTYVFDVKTTQDAKPTSFARAVATYAYHAQAAMYLDALDSVSPRARRFAWIAVEKAEPFAVSVCEADDAMIDAGRAMWRAWLEQYAMCQRDGVWRAYDSEPCLIQLPRWATNGGTV